jgi:dTDP-4-dehydrorhamnose reductase
MSKQVHTIWVTGSNGQLGHCLREALKNKPEYNPVFTSHSDVNLLNEDVVNDVLAKHKVDFVINTAAYTAVDAAEADASNAMTVNADIPMILADKCDVHGARLLHISTDYVFDGTATEPYREDDTVNPQSQYGLSKLMGEMEVQYVNKSGIIVRTSWLYSEFGHNFVKTMLRLGNEKQEIRVVNDQYGCPTYALHLAEALVKMIDKIVVEPETEYGGTYHFANDGIATWFDFATEIMKIKHLPCKVLPCTTEEYPTLAARPAYSALNCDKIQSHFELQILPWQEALRQCLQKL